ncbi:MAG: regulatory protein GemA [Burkholderia gladioli]
MISRAILAKIHVAKKHLGLDDDSYRAMLQSVGGVTSAKDLTPVSATRVLKHLERSGFVPTRPTSHRPPADDAQSAKIRALWLELYRVGAVRNASEGALSAGGVPFVVEGRDGGG